MKELRIFWILLLGCCLAQLGGCKDDSKQLLKDLRFAEDKADRMREALRDQETLVDHLDDALFCNQSDTQCLRPHLSAIQKLRRKQAERKRKEEELVPMEQRFRMKALLQLPNKASVVAAGFLPYQEGTGNKTMNKYAVVADSKGSLHVMESQTANILHSIPTEHKGHITCFAIENRLHPEYKIVTGDDKGEVRIHFLQAPKKTKKSETPRQVVNETVWEPNFVLQAAFLPAEVETVRGLADRHKKVNMSDMGPKPIKVVDFVTKGRTFNVLVGDSEGRLSMHIKNGSITATIMSKVPGPVTCITGVNQNIAALCTRQGILFYETKERRILSQGCTQLTVKDEGVPDPDPVPKKPKGVSSSDHIPSLPVDSEDNASATNKTDQQSSKKKSSMRNLNASMISFVQDPIVQASFWGSTTDGRIIGFQIRGEKSRVRCTVLHDMQVAPADGKSGGVKVDVVKGYLAALDPQTVNPTLAVYNLSGVTRANPPEMMLYHHLDFESSASNSLFLTTDKHTGVIVGSGAGAGHVWENRLPHNPPSDWNLSWLNMLRHPLLLGGIGMFFMWNMRKGKKDDGAAPAGDFDMAGAEAGKPRTFQALRGVDSNHGPCASDPKLLSSAPNPNALSPGHMKPDLRCSNFVLSRP